MEEKGALEPEAVSACASGAGVELSSRERGDLKSLSIKNFFDSIT